MRFFRNLTNEAKRIREIRPNRDIVSYLVCVVIASILWLLNTLNRTDYTTEIAYPVKYVNFPEGKYPLAELPSEIRLEIKARGFSLLGYKLKTSFLPLTLNVGAYCSHLRQKGNIFECTLDTDEMRDKIGSQLGPDIRLVNIHPSEIIFRLAETASKKVPVRPSLDYTVQKQYVLKRMSIVPDSVLVSGPAPLVDTLQYVGTRTLQLQEIRKDTKRRIELAQPPGTDSNEKSASLLLEVEPSTEARKTIRISVPDIPDSMNIRLFPPCVDISYTVGLSRYDKVSDDDFVFSADYPHNTGTDFLEVRILKQPAFIRDLSYSPQKVEYILEKK